MNLQGKYEVASPLFERVLTASFFHHPLQHKASPGLATLHRGQSRGGDPLRNVGVLFQF
jgi:hypothetical protein